MAAGLGLGEVAWRDMPGKLFAQPPIATAISVTTSSVRFMTVLLEKWMD